MRDLTQEELEEYFAFAQRQRESRARPDGFSPEQARLIGDAFRASEVVDFLINGLLAAAENQPGRIDPFIALAGAFFTMGRECESRLITRALQGRVGDA